MREVTVVFVCLGEVFNAQMLVRAEYAETVQGRRRLTDILEGNNKVYVIVEEPK